MKFKDKKIKLSEHLQKETFGYLFSEVSNAWGQNLVSPSETDEELFDDYCIYNSDTMEYCSTIQKNDQGHFYLIHVEREEGHGTYMTKKDFKKIFYDFLNEEEDGELFYIICAMNKVLPDHHGLIQLVESVVGRFKYDLSCSYQMLKTIPLPKLPMQTKE